MEYFMVSLPRELYYNAKTIAYDTVSTQKLLNDVRRAFYDRVNDNAKALQLTFAAYDLINEGHKVEIDCEDGTVLSAYSSLHTRQGACHVS